MAIRTMSLYLTLLNTAFIYLRWFKILGIRAHWFHLHYFIIIFRIISCFINFHNNNKIISQNHLKQLKSYYKILILFADDNNHLFLILDKYYRIKPDIIYILMGQQQQNIANIILELNKCGLSYLKYFQYSKSIEYLKKAENIIFKELLISTSNHKINSLASVTYNNLACYYKKTKKPKVALNYLKKSLELQVTKVNDWISTGSTHLNICAIYSSLNDHQQALCHATLALQLLQMQQKDKTQESKCYWNFKMLCHYNKAIEQEHLKLYDQSLISYKKAKQIAEFAILNNHQIINICKESITKIQADKQEKRRRFAKLILNKKQDISFLHKNLNKNRYQSIKAASKLNFQSNKQMKNVNKERNFASVNQKYIQKPSIMIKRDKNRNLMKNKTEPSQNDDQIY